MPFDQNSSGSGRHAFAITAHDSSTVAQSRGFWVGTGGDITLRGLDSTSDVVLKNVPDGTFIDLAPKYIKATGTTAGDFVGFA